jgi:hypothetical protein
MNCEEVLSRLQGVKRNGAGWVALCPAHADRNPSLSIREENGKVLVKCMAGCATESVLETVGLELRDLFGNGREARRVAATYAYTNEAGATLSQVVRYEPKGFGQRRPDGKGGWIPNLNGTRRVLYRLPEVLAAECVLVCEGEKDCETARKFGFVATCNPGGAGKWRDEYSESLRGKDVRIIPDNDPPGIVHALQIAQSLYLEARSVKIVNLPVKDLSEWPFSREALDELIEKASPWTPESTEQNWRDLFDTFEEFENARPISFSIEGFLQNEAITAIAGLSGHGKTWVALSIARGLLFGPGRLWNLFEIPKRAEKVIYLIPESTRAPIKSRLKAMGLYEELRSGRLLIRTLSKGPTPELDDVRLLRAVKGAVVILDTGIRFMRCTDESSAGEVAEGLSNDMLGLLRAEATGVGPLFHSPKSFSKESTMSLEGMIRGSSELGAVLSTAWGIKQIDEPSNTLYVQNLKARDFEHCGPFEIIGRPHIDKTGDFQLLKHPDECGSLADEQPELNKNAQAHQSRVANIELVKLWLREDPELSTEDLRKRFGLVNIEISDSTIRGYRHAIQRAEK